MARVQEGKIVVQSSLLDASGSKLNPLSYVFFPVFRRRHSQQALPQCPHSTFARSRTFLLFLRLSLVRRTEPSTPFGFSSLRQFSTVFTFIELYTVAVLTLAGYPIAIDQLDVPPQPGKITGANVSAGVLVACWTVGALPLYLGMKKESRKLLGISLGVQVRASFLLLISARSERKDEILFVSWVVGPTLSLFLSLFPPYIFYFSSLGWSPTTAVESSCSSSSP